MAIINGPAGGGAWLPGTEGDDTINAYGDGNALYGYGGTNYLYARGGNNNNLVGGPGVDHIDGGTGTHNLASYQLSSGLVIASLADPSINTGDAKGDTYVNIYDLTGSPYGGALYADNSGHNVQLWALGGTNDMFGGTGYATMISGPGADHMVGGSGGGFVDYETATAGVTASLLNPSQNTGFAAGDTYSNLHNLGGSGYDDVLYADNNGDNILAGAGNDVVHGGTAIDTVNGGPGSNTLYGGGGGDWFVFGGVAIGPGDVNLDPLTVLQDAKNGIFSTIVDFDQGNTGHYDATEYDAIDVAPLLSGQYNHGKGQPISSLVRVIEDGSNKFATLQIDTDGTSANWLTIAHLNGVPGGGTVRVIFDETQPAGVTVNVQQAANAGNDTFAGGAGNDQFDGGAGFDTVVEQGGRSQYGVSKLGDGTIQVSDGIAGRDGVDTLTSIESVHFVDGRLAFDVDDAAAQIYRIYEATLGRAPDGLGLSNWVDAIETQHKSLTEIVSGFTNSAEFKNTYGSLDNGQFVDLLYQNVLHRAADAGGRAGWVSSLQNGDSREHVVLGFSESVEFKNQIAAETQTGIWVQDSHAASIARLYYATLDRAPDVGGLGGWTASLEKGTPLNTIAAGFTNSAEFQSKYGALDNSQFVDLLYHNVLGRDADAQGKAGWLDMLSHGSTRSDIVVGFSESPEFQIKIEPHLDGGFILA